MVYPYTRIVLGNKRDHTFMLMNEFFKLIFIGVQLLYNIVLVSTLQQSESAIRIHTSSLSVDFPPI